MNFLLDTNVVSELMRPQPIEAVYRWITRKRGAALFTAATNISEICYGIHRLPSGRRRQHLEEHFEGLLDRFFVGRILPFDQDAALCCAGLRAKADAVGRPAGLADAEIAAIALTHSMTVATRDIDDFAPFGVPLVNPFEALTDP